MKKILELWWNRGNKCFSIISYKKSWKHNGNGRQFFIHENKGRRNRGDSCFDLTIAIGYIIITYTNFNLQER